MSALRVNSRLTLAMAPGISTLGVLIPVILPSACLSIKKFGLVLTLRLLSPARCPLCCTSGAFRRHPRVPPTERPCCGETRLPCERRYLSRTVFNDIVASNKLSFIFNYIVALMCRLLFLNGLLHCFLQVC